mgnify:CR=1 FL=1
MNSTGILKSRIWYSIKIKSTMKPIVIHLSNLVDSALSINGDIHIHHSEFDSNILDLLLRSLEINRKLISGFCTEWQNEEDLYTEIQKLIKQQRTLELDVANKLKSKSDGMQL